MPPLRRGRSKRTVDQNVIKLMAAGWSREEAREYARQVAAGKAPTLAPYKGKGY